MTQLHFNNLLVLLVYKERTDTLQLTACLNDFVSGSGHMRIFIVLNILSYFFMYVSVSNLHFPQMKLASEKSPEAVSNRPRLWRAKHTIPHPLW